MKITNFFMPDVLFMVHNTTQPGWYNFKSRRRKPLEKPGAQPQDSETEWKK
jgi:hypothetical protein